MNSFVESNFANHMPLLNNRNQILPTDNLQQSNYFQQRNNQSKRYHPKVAFSNGSTAEAYLKSRILLSPVYIHNEAKTKYAMISMIDSRKEEINSNMLRIF
ncbi:hypothetical protein OA848_02915 [Rickettsiales bacterium]|nr:hypothetical protein [Rickettsiales bacterium]